MKQILALLTLAPAMSMAAPQLQFLNKLDVPIQYIVGNKANPPKLSGKMLYINPGKESKSDVSDNPWVLFYEEGKPENAFIYQFNTDGKKKLAIRIVPSGKGSKLEPQTTLGTKISGNVTLQDIIPVGSGSTIGAQVKPAAPAPVHAPKIATKEKPLPAPKPAEEAPAPVPQAPPLTRPASIPAAPRLAPAPSVAPAAHKVSGPALTADLQKEIHTGKALTKAGDRPLAEKPKTQDSALVAGVQARRQALEAEDEEFEEEVDKGAEIARLAREIKKAFSQEKRLTDEIAYKIATVYVDYPPVDFASDKKVRQDVTRRIAEYAPEARAAGPISLPNVRIPVSSAGAA